MPAVPALPALPARVCHAAAQGLQIVSDTHWASANLRGFWRVGTLELLLRKDPGVTYLQNLVPGIRRVSQG